MYWKFELNIDGINYEIEEPIGWDNVNFELRRDDKTHGLNFEFSTDLEFYNKALELIKKEYFNKGIEADIFINIHEANNENSEQQIFYTGILNLNNIEFNDYAVKCKIESQDFVKEFKNQREIDVKLTPTRTVTIKNKSIKLTSKLVLQKSWETGIITNDLQTPRLEEWSTNEIENTLLPTTRNRYEPVYKNLSNEPEEITFKLQVKGKAKLTSGSIFSTPFMIWYIRINLNTGGEEIVKRTNPIYLDSDGNFTAKLDFTRQLDQGIFIYFNYFIGDDISGGAEKSWSIEVDTKESFLELSMLQSFKDSKVQCLTIFEALEQIVNEHGGNLHSDFLKLNCGKNIALTNGLLLRQKEGAELTANFKDLYDDLSKIFSLGLEVKGKTVTIEKATHFYQETEPLAILHYPKDLKLKASNNMYYSLVKVGYDKWKNNSVGISNSTDEYNSKRQYSTGIKKIERTLDLTVKKLITAGYLIEYTRRLKPDATKTSPYDNELFLLELSDDLTTTAQNEKVDFIGNVIDYQTSTNLIFTPVRMLKRALPLLSNIAAIGGDKLLQFRSGEGNYNMKSTSSSECYEAGETSEKQNLILTKRQALLIPQELNFTYPCSFQDFKDFSENAKRHLEVAGFKGYIKNIQYTPEKGEATFKLIQKND